MTLRIDIQHMREQADGIIARIAPDLEPAFACHLYAAAACGMLHGTGAAFECGAALLPPNPEQKSPIPVQWGLYGNPRNGDWLITASGELNDNGTFDGHCWVRLDDGRILDLTCGYCGHSRIWLDPFVIYHRIPRLERKVRTFNADALRAARAAGARAARQRAAA